eukprot:jgi/Hompol1/6681/HPOL_005045-RA
MGSATSKLSGSIPRSLRMNASPSRGSLGSDIVSTDLAPSGDPAILTDVQVVQIISEHLVQPGTDDQNSVGVSSSVGSVSHKLLGGDVTRNVYKWKESRDQVRPRSNSVPDLAITVSPLGVQTPRASHLQEPGMFRRQFLENKARQDGRAPPNFITRNFIDFLALYGYYGGDVSPEDDDDDDDLDGKTVADQLSIVAGSDDLASAEQARTSLSSAAGATNNQGRDGHEYSETTPLLGSNPPAHVPVVDDIKGTSPSKAFFMLLKAFVGTGVLFLPKAFLNGGLGFSLLLMVVLGYLTLHCMMLLVETSRALGGKSFGDIGDHLYGPRVRQLVLASIAVSQMGFCCAYFIFVGQNLRDLLMLVSGCKWILPDWCFILLQLVLYIPLAWVRRIKNFGITSLVADVFILLGLAYIFVYNLIVIGETGVKPVSWINLESFSLFVGTAMFAFEGICLMLPIAESMQEPQKFNGVLTWCIITIGFIFVTIGSLGYMSFGDKVETNVFLNLPKSPIVNGIQFFYAIAIMFSFPLCVYPAIRITEQAVFGDLSTGKSSPVIKWKKNAYRAVLVSLLGGVAWAGSTNLDKVVSLVGCFACIPLSFIYPSLFHMHISTSAWVRFKDALLVGFGTAAMIFTTYITIDQWIHSEPDIPLDRCANVAAT